jgi:hypothetical protein
LEDKTFLPLTKNSPFSIGRISDSVLTESFHEGSDSQSSQT